MEILRSPGKPGPCCTINETVSGLLAALAAISRRGVFVLFFTFLCSIVLFAPRAAAYDVFEQLVEMRHGANLFHQQRYQDAVDVFDPIYQELISAKTRDLQRLSTVLNFLAQSKSFLGENKETLELMQHRLSIASELYGEQSEEYFSVLAAVAEARYRYGDVVGARETVSNAIDGLGVSANKDSEYLELAQQNLAKYTSGQFSSSELPVDLSQFYTRCESIVPGESEDSVSLKMGGFAELGVDYKPEGFWAAMFEIAVMGPDGDAREGDNFRRIFLPGTDEALRQEICVVDQRSGVVTSAEDSLE